MHTIYICMSYIYMHEHADVPVELMGDLSAAKVSHCSRIYSYRRGLDKSDHNPIVPDRGHKSHKAYIALFVCFTTKALHLEFVRDYISLLTRINASYLTGDYHIPIMEPCFKAPIGNCPIRIKVIRGPNFHDRLTSGTAWYFLPPALRRSMGGQH